jgi:hypothetical protein
MAGQKVIDDPAWYCLTMRFQTMERLLGAELANTKHYKTPAGIVSFLFFFFFPFLLC